MKKRLISLTLVLVLLLSLMPMGVMAADDITVYVSVSEDGYFVSEKDDKVIANVPVTVTAEEPSIDDAFLALHEEYYEGENGYKSSSNGWITTFWGKDASYSGYMVNGGYANSTADPIADGDYLSFWFYQDTISWSDTYTFFENNTAAVGGGEALNLTLTAAGSPLSGATITVDGEEVAGKLTDEDGRATLYFAEEGTYIVSANAPQGEYIVPPVCIITVTGNDNTAAAVNADKEALSIASSATENLSLPVVGTSGKTAISWVSSDSSVISNSGLVTRGAEEKSVTLTATLSYGESSDTKEFTVTVPALSDTELLEIAVAVLETEDSITLSQWNAAGTALQDINIVKAAQAVVNNAVYGVTVDAVVVSENSAIDNDGSITYPDYMYGYGTAETGNVTFTLRNGDEEASATVSVTVPVALQSRQAIMDSVTEETIKEYALGENSAWDSITMDLELIEAVSNIDEVSMEAGMMVNIAWNYSECPNLERYGTVIRPEYGDSDVQFTLEATLSWNSSMDPYASMLGIALTGNTPESKTFTFPLTIKAYTEEEYNAAKEKVDAAIAAFDPGTITYYDGGAVADLNAVTGDLMLPEVDKEAPYGTYETDWTTNNSEVVAAPSYNTGRAVVTRPAVGAEDANCILTMSVTADGYTATKEFTVTVKALTQEEVDAAQAEVQEIADKLTFDVIKDNNTNASAVSDRLRVWRSASFNEDGTIAWSASAYPTTGFKIDWTCDPEGIFDQYGYVTAPGTDTEVTLTASVYSADKSYTQPVTVEIVVTVIVDREANTSDELKTIMDNIAAGYVDSTGEWVVMDMGAYAATFPEAESKTTADAKQSYLNTVIGKLSAASVGETTYSKSILALAAQGIDPAQLYAVNSNTAINAIEGLSSKTHGSSAWVAPYTMAALNQGDYDTDAAEQAIIDAVLENQKEDGSWAEWGDSIQTTSNMIAGLAFYAGDEEVDAAIAKAVEYLSSVQEEDGSFDAYGSGADGNTMAMVVIGLAANGINPDTDYRFIKNGNSALDALLSFAVEGNNGFGYTSNATINASATEQGFRALIAAYNVMSTGIAYNVYDHSGNSLTPGRATGSGTVITPREPEGDDITVTVTIKSDTGYWLNGKSVTIPGTGATVYHAFIKALEGSGITQIGAADGYVESMTKDGRTLAEFTNGENSGWMYKLNGELPEVGLTECAIENGDSIVWFYTDDWTTVPGISIPSVPSTPDTPDDGEDSEKPGEEPKDFIDVTEGAWYCEAIDFVTALGIMNGVSDDKFDPNGATTRAMVWTMLARIDGVDTSAGATWYEAGQKWAIEKGVSDGTMAQEKVTREQLVTMIWRYLGEPKSDYDLSDFSDHADISDWALAAMKWAVESGVIKGMGDGTLNPGGNANRAQVAQMFMNFLGI